MTERHAVPELESLIAAERDAIDALLLLIGNQHPAERHKSLADSKDLQQCLLHLVADTSRPLCDQVVDKLEALETLAPRQYAAIQLSERVVEQFFFNAVFRPELVSALNTIRQKIAANALDHNGWLYSQQHPLREFCNRLAQYACGWTSGSGRVAEMSLQKTLAIIEPVQSDWQPALQAFEAWQNTEQTRAQKLEQRLIDSETGAMKARRARQIATKTLNQLLTGKKIPPGVVEFFQGPWFQSMVLGIIQGGERGELFFRQRKLTETLIWSLQPIKDETHRQQLFRVITQLAEELRDVLIYFIHQPEAKDIALQTIEESHLHLVQNNAVETIDAPLLDNSDSAMDANTSISRSLLARVESLSVGQWFEFPHQTEQQRLKLLIKQDDSQQLLFVTQLGVKALVQSFDEFAYQLASGGAIALHAESLFDECCRDVLTQLQQTIADNIAHAERLAIDMRLKQEAEQRVREMARRKAEQEAAELAAAKEKAEKERREAAELAEQQHRLEALAAQGADEAARLQRARLLASSLTIGAWLEWRNELGDVEKLKLAVLLPTSGKSILVDRNGIKKHELQREELIRHFADGSLTLLNTGKQFDDALARVVGGLRRDRN